MHDVAVVGGSVAGLQASLTLGRARRRVLLFDDGKPRNGPAAHVHNFLGQVRTSPSELLGVARTMLAPYDVTVMRERVRDITAAGDGFTVGGHGMVRAVVLATGMSDELPDVPGIGQLWGDLVVACPHCHGWEVRDRPLAQLGWRGQLERGVQRALLLRGWTSDVTFLTDGDDLTPTAHTRLAAAGVTIRTEPVERVDRGGEYTDHKATSPNDPPEPGRVPEVTTAPDQDRVVIRLAGGEVIERRALFTVVRQRQQCDLAARLGCRLDPETGAVLTDLAGRTSVHGVWAAGTTTFPALLAIGAAGHASSVATALHAELAGL